MSKSRRTSLLEAAQVVQAPAADESSVTAAVGRKSEAASSGSVRQRSRVGKKPATTYISPEAKKQLLMLKLELDIDVEDLIRSGINMVFEKHKKPPIA